MHFMLTILKVIYVLSTLMRWIMEGEKLEHVGGGKCGNDDYIYKWEVLWSLIIYVHEVPRSLALNLFKTCTLLVSLFFVVETYFLIMIIWRRYLKVNLSFSLNVRVGVIGFLLLDISLPNSQYKSSGAGVLGLAMLVLAVFNMSCKSMLVFFKLFISKFKMNCWYELVSKLAIIFVANSWLFELANVWFCF